ncbi:MAG TPA: CPBP family intramembrane glutamic endopeptidase [Bryobacteraceae bacterium]|nr:CPBP family intramembrane glutamic endopeptidase [Bryobacteraceae bacterium]
MAKSLGSFRAALLIGWVALGAAGVLFARAKGIPNWAALPVLAAILVEYPFYLVAGFSTVRERQAGMRLPGFLLASALLPYLIYSVGTGQFRWDAFLRLAALALGLSLWYVVLPAAPVLDLAFLALIAAVLLGGYFDNIYTPPYAGFSDVKILGHLALIQIAVMVLTLERRIPETGYGFVPTRKDWRIGVVHYLYFLPIGLSLALILGVIRFNGIAAPWKIVGTFFGILWVVALSEEFFFRGVLFQWIEDWTWSPRLALLITSILFGSVHLWFAGKFPNWQQALVAAVLGWFCGRARMKAGSIQAGMVTHALVVTTWRAFFS